MKSKAPRTYDGRIHKPVKEVIEGIEFASAFETQVYRHIRMLFSKEYVTCHAPIAVIPETKHFPARNWKCDFRLDLPWRNLPIFIEAKGVNTAEFKLLLQTLAYTNPEAIDSLLVVHSEVGVKIGRCIQTVNIHFMFQYLLRFKN